MFKFNLWHSWKDWKWIRHQVVTIMHDWIYCWAFLAINFWDSCWAQAAQLHSIADWHQRRGIGKQGLPFAEAAAAASCSQAVWPSPGRPFKVWLLDTCLTLLYLRFYLPWYYLLDTWYHLWLHILRYILCAWCRAPRCLKTVRLSTSTIWFSRFSWGRGQGNHM